MPAAGGGAGGRAARTDRQHKSAPAATSHPAVFGPIGDNTPYKVPVPHGHAGSLFRHTSSYHQAVRNQFDNSTRQQQQHIIHGAVRHPHNEAAQVVLHHVQALGLKHQMDAVRHALEGLGQHQLTHVLPSGLVQQVGHGSDSPFDLVQNPFSDTSTSPYDPGSPPAFSDKGEHQLAQGSATIAAGLGKAIDRGQQILSGGHFGAGQVAGPLGIPVASASPPALPKPVGHVIGGLARNIAQYPVEAVPALAQVAGDIVRGHPGKAVKETKQALTGGVIGKLLKGDTKGALKSAYDNPGFALAELAGAKAVVGRGTGAVARSPISPKAVRKAASTKRPDLKLVGGQTERQHYSKDLINKAVQVGLEKRKAKKGLDPQQSYPATRGPLQARRGLEAKLNRAANEANSAHEVTRRQNRAAQSKLADQASPARAHTGPIRALLKAKDQKGPHAHGPLKSAPEADVVSMVYQRAVDARDPKVFEASLRAHRARLEKVFQQEGKNWPSDVRAMNRAKVRDIDRVLKDKKALANAANVAKSAQTLVDARNAVSKQLEEHGVYSPTQAKAALYPYMQEHMGATWDHGGKPTPAALKFRDARKAERSQAAGVRTATARLADAQRREAAVMARAKAVRGPVRGRKDLTGKPLPKDMAERIFKAQRRTALAEDLLAAAKGDFAATRHQRIALHPHRNRVTSKRMVGPGGQDLSTATVLAHMNAHGIKPPAHFTHQPDVLSGMRPFLQRYRGSRTGGGSQARTGEAFRTGGHAHSYEHLKADLVRSQGVLDRVRRHDQVVTQFGIKREKPAAGGGVNADYFTAAEAEAEARRRMFDDHNNRLPTPALVPLKAFLSSADKEHLGKILDHQDPAAAENVDKLVGSVFDQARHVDQQSADRNVVLVPESQLRTYLQHEAPKGIAERGMGRVTGQFTKTVLPFSPKWLEQNIGEAQFRMLMRGVLPGDRNIGKRLVAQWIKDDPVKGAELSHRVLGQGLYGSRATLSQHRDPMFLTGLMHKLPIVHYLPEAINGLGNRVFRFNTWYERQTRLATLGKYHRREVQEFTDSWLASMAHTKKYVEQLANGYHDVATAADAGRFLDETLGKYGKFGPATKSAIQTYAPFLPWYLNSARFVLWTLPAHHPIKLAVLTSMERAFHADYAQAHQGAEGNVKGAVPSGGGFKGWGKVIGVFDPFSDPLGAAGSVMLPQAGFLKATQGKDPFGNDLTGPDGKVKKGSLENTWIALYSLGEAYAPILRDIRTAREGGASAYSTSTVFDPQTKPYKHSGGWLEKLFNPARTFYVKGGRSTSSGPPKPGAGPKPGPGPRPGSGPKPGPGPKAGAGPKAG